MTLINFLWLCLCTHLVIHFDHKETTSDADPWPPDSVSSGGHRFFRGLPQWVWSSLRPLHSPWYLAVLHIWKTLKTSNYTRAWHTPIFSVNCYYLWQCDKYCFTLLLKHTEKTIHLGLYQQVLHIWHVYIYPLIYFPFKVAQVTWNTLHVIAAWRTNKPNFMQIFYLQEFAVRVLEG